MSKEIKTLPEPFHNFKLVRTCYIRTVAIEGNEIPGKSEKTGLPLPVAIFSPEAKRLVRFDTPGAWSASAKKGRVSFLGRVAEIQVIETRNGRTKDEAAGAKAYRFSGPTVEVNIRGPDDFKRVFGPVLDTFKPSGLVGSMWTGACVSGRNERLLQSACNWSYSGKSASEPARSEEWTTSLDAFESCVGNCADGSDDSDSEWDGQLTSVADTDDEYN